MRILKLSICACLALGLTTAVLAEATPEAKQWLEKMAQMESDKAFSMDFVTEMQMTQGDQTMSMTGNGTMLKLDATHLTGSVEMTMSGIPGMGDMSMKMKMVADGTHYWMDMDNPMSGRMVGKMTLEQFQQMQESGQAGMGGGPQPFDPMDQVKELQRLFDLSVDGVSDGRVTLRGLLNQEALGEISQGQQFDAMGVNAMVMVLDEETALPQEMRIETAAGPLMTMRFENVKVMDPAAVDKDKFNFTPPEGVQVMDLGAMMGGGPR